MMNEVLYFHEPPVQAWENLVFVQKGLMIDVLRLDAIHPLVSGNKWMKLNEFLQKAIAEKKAGVFTKGGPWSNHLHASAWVCRQMGLPMQVWVKGNEKLQTAMLTDIIDWGAEIRFINRQLFYDEAAAEAFAAQNNLQYIPMGGADKIGVEAATQYLQEQHLQQYNYAVCAVGTATTFGGLAFTTRNFKTVVGIDAGTNDESLPGKINDWQQELPGKKLLLNTDYGFGGFSRRTPELVNFANRFFAETGIPTDIVYTAKLFFAVEDLAVKNFFPPGSKILVIHSGGLQGNRSLPPGTLNF